MVSNVYSIKILKIRTVGKFCFQCLSLLPFYEKNRIFIIYGKYVCFQISVICTSTIMSNEVQKLTENILSDHIGILSKPFLTTSSDNPIPHSSFATNNFHHLEDPIGCLQEFCVKNSLPLPTYNLQNTNPNPSQYHFRGEVGSISFDGYATLKKDAKKDSASGLLAKVKAGLKVTYQEIDEEIEAKLLIEFKQDK